MSKGDLEVGGSGLYDSEHPNDKIKEYKCGCDYNETTGQFQACTKHDEEFKAILDQKMKYLLGLDETEKICLQKAVRVSSDMANSILEVESGFTEAEEKKMVDHSRTLLSLFKKIQSLPGVP
jgi:hypothetical protein